MIIVPGYPDVVGIPTHLPLDDVFQHLRLYEIYRRAVVLRADLRGELLLPATAGARDAHERGRFAALHQDLAEQCIAMADSSLRMPGHQLQLTSAEMVRELDQALVAIEQKIDLQPQDVSTVLLNAYFP